MSALPGLRAVVIAGGALAAISLTTTANAEENPAPRIDFRDPTALTPANSTLNLSARGSDARFATTAPSENNYSAPRPVEVQLAAGREHTGAPVDVAFAHRNLMSGDDERSGHGSEVRIGRGLVATRNHSDPHPSVYAFVASDDQALTWRPGARSEFGGPGTSLALQEQVEIGDHAAGVTYERNGVQTSLAYVERRVTTHVGHQGFSQDENFAGVTVTVRHAP